MTKKIAKQSETPLIGMGENLAQLLIASYGGHFLRILGAVCLFKHKKESFEASDSLNPIGQDITRVIKDFPKDGLKLLRQLAETGFAPVTDTRDPCAEQIVEDNIGGIISRSNSYVVGVPDAVWKGVDIDSGLVPISESARNLIAAMVLSEEQER